MAIFIGGQSERFSSPEFQVLEELAREMDELKRGQELDEYLQEVDFDPAYLEDGSSEMTTMMTTTIILMSGMTMMRSRSPKPNAPNAGM